MSEKATLRGGSKWRLVFVLLGACNDSRDVLDVVVAIGVWGCAEDCWVSNGIRIGVGNIARAVCDLGMWDNDALDATTSQYHLDNYDTLWECCALSVNGDKPVRFGDVSIAEVSLKSIDVGLDEVDRMSLRVAGLSR